MRQAKLDLRGCNARDINNLPEMQVDGKVLFPNLDQNKEMKRIPILGLKVVGSLSLSGCKNLISLPIGLKVTGSLSLSGCESLESLPVGLKVGGYLSLVGCKLLTSLPDGLRIGEKSHNGFLRLEGCINIKSLPKDLEVKDDIWYNSETGFTKIDGWEDDPNIIPTHLRDKLWNSII